MTLLDTSVAQTQNKEHLTDDLIPQWLRPRIRNIWLMTLLDTSVAQTQNKEHLTDDFTWHLCDSDRE